MYETSWVQDSAESQHLVSEVLALFMPKHGGQGGMIVDAIADGVA